MNPISQKKSSILLVEDKDFSSDSLRGYINLTGRNVIGPIIRKKEAIKILDEDKNNEIVAGVIDLRLPNDDNPLLKEDPNMGFDVALHMKELRKHVIIISGGDFPSFIEKSILNGFSFLAKDDLSKTTLPSAIELTILNHVVYSELIRNEINRLIQDKKLVDPLSIDEWKILYFRINNHTFSQISMETNFADSTLRVKIKEIFNKIHVNNTIEASRWFDLNVKKYNHLDLFIDNKTER